MNLLGLLLRGIIERRLEGHAPRLRGDVAIDASGMRVTLRFAPDAVAITRAAAVKPVARVRGTLTALADAALGRGRLRAFLDGRLRVRGRPLALLRLLSLLRVS